MRAHDWVNNLVLTRPELSGSVKRERQRVKDQIDKDVERFLESGGQITHCGNTLGQFPPRNDAA